MKLPVMMRCQWADGSFDDEPAFGIVSGDTSMVSITANANGDSMATITPADSQSHLVAITGPPTLVPNATFLALPPVNFDALGSFLGNINYAPYASCN
jgi:hypothetical protein